MPTLTAGATQSMVCTGAGFLCIIYHVVTLTLCHQIILYVVVSTDMTISTTYLHLLSMPIMPIDI